MDYSIDFIKRPDVVEVNREYPVSSHEFYSSMENLVQGDRSDVMMSLNGMWSFIYFPSHEVLDHSFLRDDFDLSSLDNIEVPSHIQMHGYDKIHYTNTIYPWDSVEDIVAPEVPSKYNPVGVYLKDVDFVDIKDVYIDFEGVESAFYLFVNGDFVGYAEDSFTHSRFRLDPFLKKGRNRIVVQVHKFSTGSWMEDQDFWRFSGIFRDVNVYKMPVVHVNDLYVQCDLKNDYKDVDVLVDLKFLGDVKGASCRLWIQDQENCVYDSGVMDVRDTLMHRFEIEDIHAWSDENPYLYDLYIEVFKDDELVELVYERIGFREIKIVDGLILLNGQRLIIRGVNRHEFNYRHGRVVSMEDMLWDIKFLKRNNFNAVRTSHYPNVKEWYRLCDEFGILLMDEANIESHGTWQKYHGVDGSEHIPGNLEEWKHPTLDRGINMLERDKNHPSIIMWSCGNESYAGTNLLALSHWFKKRDPRRIVHYEGVFWNREYNEISDVESRMYAKVADIEEYLSQEPEKPFISCEYSHAMGNSCGNIGEYSDLEEKFEMYQGGFIWDYIDQGLLMSDDYGEEYIAFGGDFGDRPTDYNFCINGIVNADRSPSPKVQEIKHVFSPVKIKLDSKKIDIWNSYKFSNLSEFDVFLKISNKTEYLWSQKLDLDLKPYEREILLIQDFFDIDRFSQEHFILLEVEISLKEDTFYANKGYVVVKEQVILKDQLVKEKGHFDFIDGDGNIRVFNDEISAMFHKQKGLVSYKIQGYEILNNHLPKPLFVRALTDNDKGNHLAFQTAYWYGASIASRVSDYRLELKDESISLHFDYALPMIEETIVRLTYAFKDNAMFLHYDYKGLDHEDISLIPQHAIHFELDKNFKDVTYYGRGPKENYIDRNRGAYLGRYNLNVVENKSQYVIPQEYGNRTDVHELSLYNEKEGISLEIEKVDESFEFKVLPHSYLELESASHQHELNSRMHYSYLTLIAKQMGVGGDDSWGAPVLEQYQISAKDPLKFTFKIRGVKHVRQ